MPYVYDRNRGIAEFVPLVTDLCRECLLPFRDSWGSILLSFYCDACGKAFHHTCRMPMDSKVEWRGAWDPDDRHGSALGVGTKVYTCHVCAVETGL